MTVYKWNLLHENHTLLVFFYSFESCLTEIPSTSGAHAYIRLLMDYSQGSAFRSSLHLVPVLVAGYKVQGGYLRLLQK